MKRKTIVILCASAALFLAVVCLLAMGVFAKRQALTTEEFETRMTSAGFRVQNLKGNWEPGSVQGAKLAWNGRYRVEFYVMPSAGTAISTFNDNKSKIETKESKSSGNFSVSASNFNYYARTDDDNHYVISRTDNTVLYLRAPKKYRDDADETIASLGY